MKSPLQTLSEVLLSDLRVEWLLSLRESGWLCSYLPEVYQLSGVEQNPEWHPEGDVWNHTLKALSLLPPKPSFDLGFGVLVHDIGKTATTRVRKGKITSYRHENVGARLVPTVCNRLGIVDEALVNNYIWLVANHMKFNSARQMRQKTLVKWFSHPWFETLLELHRVDRLSSNGDLGTYKYCCEQYLLTKSLYSV